MTAKNFRGPLFCRTLHRDNGLDATPLADSGINKLVDRSNGIHL